jgi:hypothetical protein
MTFKLSFMELGRYRSYYGKLKLDTAYAYAEAKDNAKFDGKEGIYLKQSHVLRTVVCLHSELCVYTRKQHSYGSFK